MTALLALAAVLLDALRRFLPKTEHLLAGLPPFTGRGVLMPASAHN